ncbi:hypothetical protein TrLO_g10550 [Triparma laevis f. longispina]|uniref:Uncharacterized protein n=1 Tax=Triparma laevis f. longispina TaxID=1714387 RepID=A0A9W7L091_9STRA|nr:hypothetical protein TrLO_g10550 [Triparma laevis f. longispina]
MYSFEDMDKECFQKAFVFCFVDLALETVTYVSMVIFVMLKVFFAFFKYQKLYWTTLATGCCIAVASFSFFMKHYGIDPLFKWNEF